MLVSAPRCFLPSRFSHPPLKKTLTSPPPPTARGRGALQLRVRVRRPSQRRAEAYVNPNLRARFPLPTASTLTSPPPLFLFTPGLIFDEISNFQQRRASVLSSASLDCIVLAAGATTGVVCCVSHTFPCSLHLVLSTPQTATGRLQRRPHACSRCPTGVEQLPAALKEPWYCASPLVASH